MVLARNDFPEYGNDLPDYSNPPVVEVVCGVQFESLDGFVAPHLGFRWESLQPDYPFFKEFPPLAAQIEPEHLLAPGQVNIRLHEKPPLARMWYTNDDESRVVQVQRDRFLTNWKKVSDEQPYPRFPDVFGLFSEKFSLFRDFVEGSIGSVKPLQYELSYVNQIPLGDGWSSYAEVGKVLADHEYRTGVRFLPSPEVINWTTAFQLPQGLGRLYIAAVSASRVIDKRPVLQLTLTARGINSPAELESMADWFDVARQWIVRGFTDLTGESMQYSVWGRIK
jgi:uncharacterized protein (TIGR04255 family)